MGHEVTITMRNMPDPAVGARVAHFFKVRGAALGMGLFNVYARARHRFGRNGGLRVQSLDHLTIPCGDLGVAEAFYVGVLGARVLMRIDEAFLRRMGRSGEDAARARHISLVWSGGPRVDLFEHPLGQPPLLAAHPHYAFTVAPDELPRWKARLEQRGVPTQGPTQLGPPGQASLYFNDPFGNHLELTTLGFTGTIPIGPPDMAALAYTWKPGTAVGEG
jgi:catechol 2,3-dioxygenase-like lactoylglutathione lyase family enzyme